MEYDLLGSNDMKDVVNFLGNVMRSRAHGLFICSALQIALRYKTFCSEKKKEGVINRDDSCEWVQ